MMGPLACGLSTGAGAVFHTARPLPGASLVVYGVGTVGLAAIMAATNSPATTIIAVDRHASRLGMATEMGATHVVDAADTNVVEAINDICGGPADVALECTGVISVVRQAVDSVGMRGTCILIGGAPAGAEFSVDHLSTLWGKSIVGTLGGSGRSLRLIGGLMGLYAAGALSVRPSRGVLPARAHRGGRRGLVQRRRDQARADHAELTVNDYT